MAKFIEVLTDGLTVQGRVQRAGARVQVREDFPVVTKKSQTKRWGSPRYREITRADFENSGGEVEEDLVFTDDTESSEDAGVEEVVNPFAAFEGKNVDETLQLAMALSEDELAAFIVYERENANRISVLQALGAGGE